MTAITTASNARDFEDAQNAAIGSYAVKTSVTIPQGAIVQIVSATGRVTNASQVTGRKMCGIALETKTAGTATAATVQIKVRVAGTVKLTTSVVTKAYIGCNLAVKDNNTVTTNSGGGTAAIVCLVGRCKKVGTSVAWVEINRLGQRVV